jgi:hypothetical protein
MPDTTLPPRTCAACSLLILIIVFAKAMDAGPSTASTCSFTMSMASRLCTPSVSARSVEVFSSTGSTRGSMSTPMSCGGAGGGGTGRGGGQAGM